MSKFRTIECVDEDKYSVYYKTTCGCGDNNHDMHLLLEYDKKLKYMGIWLSMELFTDTGYIWKHLKWYERLLRRICGSFRLLFLGRIEYNGEFIFSGEEHVRDFIEALEEGLNKMKEAIEENKKDENK